MTFSKNQLQVHWWDGALIGHLVNRGSLYFIYDKDWIKRGDNLSPLSLPFHDIAFNGSKGINGLPGLIADCLPDAWGEKVARREFSENKWGAPTPISLLAWRGARGLGALQFLPPFQADSPSPLLETIHLAALARGAAEIQRGEPTEVLSQLCKGGTAGGAYPKALVLAYSDGTLRVGNPDGSGVPSLLKFDLSENGENAKIEHAYTRMAQSAGIRTVETQLIREKRPAKSAHLLVKRFDLPDPQTAHRRSHFHSMSGLLHKSPTALDYRDLFRAIIRLGAPPSELRELARRMTFNVLASNHDDHGKNHAVLYDEKQRRWALSPAYDLTFSSGMIERGIHINGEIWPSFATMEKLCKEAGISKEEFKTIFDEVDQSIAQWRHFASGISPLKKAEIQARHRLIRARVFPQ